ncbi:MAG TPA: PAS domain-containing protein [Alphaproteobacteria bacterium]|nr:PAS domain-containing protein [Alphaproteobacteria bacterium]
MSKLIADNPILSALWRYWCAQRGARAAPRRADIDPVHIPRLLPYLQLVERTEAGRFRYRLTGTAVVEAYGRELTGLHVDEVMPPPRRAVAERHYALVFDGGRPIFVRNRYTSGEAAELVVSRIILPLAGEDGRVALLLMGQTFEYGSAYAERLGAGLDLDPGLDRIDYL